jgi:hypothetical protein
VTANVEEDNTVRRRALHHSEIGRQGLVSKSLILRRELMMRFECHSPPSPPAMKIWFVAMCVTVIQETTEDNMHCFICPCALFIVMNIMNENLNTA